MPEDFKLWEEFEKIINDYGKTKDERIMRIRLNLLKARFQKAKDEKGRIYNNSLLKQLGEFL